MKYESFLQSQVGPWLFRLTGSPWQHAIRHPIFEERLTVELPAFDSISGDGLLVDRRVDEFQFAVCLSRDR